MRLIGLMVLMGVMFSLQAAVGEPIRHFRTQDKVVALTFDDGPGTPYTEQILAILAKHQVKATFYILGNNAKTYPGIIHKMIKDGHELGNHTMQHSKMRNQSVSEMVKDISAVDSVLRDLGYQQTITFRAPYGITSANLTQALKQLNKPHVLFDFLPQDWTPISADEILQNIMVRVKPGLIITLHDGGKRRENTVIATEKLIVTLKNRGYRFALVSEFVS